MELSKELEDFGFTQEDMEILSKSSTLVDWFEKSDTQENLGRFYDIPAKLLINMIREHPDYLIKIEELHLDGCQDVDLTTLYIKETYKEKIPLDLSGLVDVSPDYIESSTIEQAYAFAEIAYLLGKPISIVEEVLIEYVTLVYYVPELDTLYTYALFCYEDWLTYKEMSFKYTELYRIIHETTKAYREDWLSQLSSITTVTGFEEILKIELSSLSIDR